MLLTVDVSGQKVDVLVVDAKKNRCFRSKKLVKYTQGLKINVNQVFTNLLYQSFNLTYPNLTNPKLI